MYKPIPTEEKFQDFKSRFFRALKCSYELAGDDVENCQLSIDTYKSLTSLVILY